MLLGNLQQYNDYCQNVKMPLGNLQQYNDYCQNVKMPLVNLQQYNDYCQNVKMLLGNLLNITNTLSWAEENTMEIFKNFQLLAVAATDKRSSCRLQHVLFLITIKQHDVTWEGNRRGQNI